MQEKKHLNNTKTLTTKNTKKYLEYLIILMITVKNLDFNSDCTAITLQHTRVLLFESSRKEELKQSALLLPLPLVTLVKWTD